MFLINCIHKRERLSDELLYCSIYAFDNNVSLSDCSICNQQCQYLRCSPMFSERTYFRKWNTAAWSLCSVPRCPKLGFKVMGFIDHTLSHVEAYINTALIVTLMKLTRQGYVKSRFLVILTVINASFYIFPNNSKC